MRNNTCPISEDMHKMYLIYKSFLERPSLRYAVLKLLGLHNEEIFKDDII